MLRSWSQSRKGFSPWASSSTERTRIRILIMALGLILVRTWGTFVADDILLGSQLPSAVLTFYLLTASAALFAGLHRPWTRSYSFTPATYWRIALNGAVLAVATFLWVFGIRHCRALRSMVLECADLPLMLFFILNTRINRREALDPDQQRVRGSIVTLIGVGLTLLSLLTTCTIDTASNSLVHHHSKRLVCSGFIPSTLGTAALFLSTLLVFSRLKKSQALAAEVGGLRTLNCFSLIAAALWALPIGVTMTAFGRSPLRPPRASFPILLNSLLCALSTVMIHLYMEPFLVAKGTQIPQLKEARLLCAFICSVALSFLRGDRQANVLIFVAFLLLEVGLHLRTSGRNLLAVSGTLEQRLPQPHVLWNHPFVQDVRDVLSHSLSRPSSRRILLFLLLSSTFMVIEAAVGLIANSLGLMGDAGHMLFDNAALIIGLWASCMSDRRADARYPYGYHRYEVVAGFVNAIFLVFVAITIMVEALERFSEPPPVGSPHLLITSVAGFLINVIGLLLFGHLAHHQPQPPSPSGAKPPHLHTDCHADLLGPASLSHHHHHHHHPSPILSSASSCLHLFRNVNLQGIFLHLLADALGSLSVITSSLLIHLYGLHIADPICSILVAILIMWSSGPLITSSASILLQRLPPEVQSAIQASLDVIRHLDGVDSIAHVNSWQVPVVVVVAITIRVRGPEVDKHKLLQAVRHVVFDHLNPETTDLTVQIEQVGAVRSVSSSSGGGGMVEPVIGGHHQLEE